MRIWQRATLSAILVLGLQAYAEGQKYGIGFVLGDPTAISGRYNISEDHAADLQVSFNRSYYVLVYGDYLFKFKGLFGHDTRFAEQLTAYTGAGPMAVFATKSDHDKGSYFDKRDDAVALAARIPFGIEWTPEKIPLGIGIELAPGVVVIPATAGFLQGGVTLRWYF